MSSSKSALCRLIMAVAGGSPDVIRAFQKMPFRGTAGTRSCGMIRPASFRRTSGSMSGSGGFEDCSVHPHSVHDEGEFSRDRYFRLFRADPLDELQSPAPKLAFVSNAGQECIRRLEQKSPRHAVSRLRYTTAQIHIAGLIATWRQSQERADVPGVAEPAGIIDGRHEGQCRYGAHTGNRRHAPTASGR